jgi:hypothetical protein
MRKLKLSVLLPVIQLPLALVLWEWGGRLPLPSLGSGHFRAGPLVCYGINAPAVFLRLVVFPFTRGSRQWAQPSIFGYGPEEWSFFLGVVILWFLVGTLLDQRGSENGLSDKRMTVIDVLLRLSGIVLGVVIGIALFVEGQKGLRIPYRWGDYQGTVVESILFLVWSFVLICFSGVKVTRMIRRVIRR